MTGGALTGIDVSRRVLLKVVSWLVLPYEMGQYFRLFNIDKCIYSEKVYTDASMDELHSDVFQRDLKISADSVLAHTTRIQRKRRDESASGNPRANIGAFIQIL
ncbi:hypothetical protein BDZ89DRAFT_1071809, partial [Hymenopellis radicata]